MKSIPVSAIFLTLGWTVVFLNIGFISYSQSDTTRAPILNDDVTRNAGNSGLHFSLTDTILPTVSNSGQGLLDCKCTFYNIPVNHGHYYPKVEGESTVIRMYYNESDLRALQNQMRLINEQYHYQLKKEKKLKNMDLNLGEVIKGFYIQPVF